MHPIRPTSAFVLLPFPVLLVENVVKVIYLRQECGLFIYLFLPGGKLRGKNCVINGLEEKEVIFKK